jgi:hypothetical protein
MGLLGARDISGAIQNAERTWIWNQIVHVAVEIYF